jgi:hypothetical protein
MISCAGGRRSSGAGREGRETRKGQLQRRREKDGGEREERLLRLGSLHSATTVRGTRDSSLESAVERSSESALLGATASTKGKRKRSVDIKIVARGRNTAVLSLIVVEAALSPSTSRPEVCRGRTVAAMASRRKGQAEKQSRGVSEPREGAKVEL